PTRKPRGEAPPCEHAREPRVRQPFTCLGLIHKYYGRHKIEAPLPKVVGVGGDGIGQVTTESLRSGATSQRADRGVGIKVPEKQR
ncbi:MAG: hypothetical protein ACKPKO_10015, partial [Candidatus Fonsibacter sp.]